MAMLQNPELEKKLFDTDALNVEEIERKNEEPGYITRFKGEIIQLKGRLKRLHKIIVLRDANKLEFDPKCSLYLLLKQEEAMREYLRTLEVRAAIEEIEI